MSPPPPSSSPVADQFRLGPSLTLQHCVAPLEFVQNTDTQARKRLKLERERVRHCRSLQHLHWHAKTRLGLHDKKANHCAAASSSSLCC